MKDYYAILNILPDADADVVKAAYKALIKKYHPDVFKGDQNVAHQASKDLNEAYEVLSDHERRKQYDAERASSGVDEGYMPEPDFDPNKDIKDSDWDVAAMYFPSLKDQITYLNKLSPRLAFSFKALLLESKNFEEATNLFQLLKKEFLGNYFGSNELVQELGERLILARERDAARFLNHTIAVMGKAITIDKISSVMIERYPRLKRSVFSDSDQDNQDSSIKNNKTQEQSSNYLIRCFAHEAEDSVVEPFRKIGWVMYWMLTVGSCWYGFVAFKPSVIQFSDFWMLNTSGFGFTFLTICLVLTAFVALVPRFVRIWFWTICLGSIVFWHSPPNTFNLFKFALANIAISFVFAMLCEKCLSLLKLKKLTNWKMYDELVNRVNADLYTNPEDRNNDIDLMRRIVKENNPSWASEFEKSVAADGKYNSPRS